MQSTPMMPGTCLVCGDALSGPWVVACGRCETPHHRDCFQYAGRCAVYACNSTRAVDANGRKIEGTWGTPARPVEPAPADPAPIVDDPTWPVFYDYRSASETLSRGALLVGGLVAAAAPLIAFDPSRFMFDPAFQLGAGLAVAGAAGSILIDDMLLVDPRTRTIRLHRTLGGMQSSAELYAFAAVRAVRLESARSSFSTLTEKSEGHWRAWLALELATGQTVRLGDIHGSPGWDPRRDLERIGRRIAAAIGVRFAAHGAVGEVPLSYHVPYTFRKAAWCVALLLAMRWGLIAISQHTAGDFLWACLPVLAGAVLIAHWWFLARPLGTMGVAASTASDRLVEAYRQRKSGRGSDTPGELTALILTAVGLLAVGGTTHAFFEDLRAAMHYRTTAGQVVTHRAVSRRVKNGTVTDTEVYYAYQVDGSERKGMVTWANTGGRGPWSKAIEVHYDPLSPDRSLLTRPQPWFNLPFVILALLLFESGVRFWTRLFAITRPAPREKVD